MKGVTEVSVPLVASFLSESWGHQSLAFRWTPGTRRSSFSTENKSLYISRNAKNLSRILGSTIARVLARGYLPQLHMENFVVSDRDSHVDLTDFSDLEPLSGFLKSNSGIEDMLRKLELLLNGNYINLSYEFDPIEFWRGLADECDKMGLLGVGFDLDVKPKLKARSSDLFYRSESYVRLTEDKNIQYVLRRLLTLGIVVSIGGQNVPIQHGLNVEGTISKLDLALAIGKEGYASRRERVMEIVREGMFEQLDRDVVHEFEVFRVRNRLDWSVEGARKFFAQERFRESYRDYLRSFTEFYRAGRFEHRFFIEGEIDKIVEMKMIIYAQVELVIKLDILQHSYRHVGDTAKADHYLKHLEEILAQDPFEFLKAYEKR